METLIIQSIESDAKLTLFEPGPANIKEVVDGFRAKLESHKIPPSECNVFGANGEYLCDFLKAINKETNTKKNYYSLEDHMVIDAWYENNFINLNIKLREGPYEEDWEVEENFVFGEAAYKQIISDLAAFLRVKI